MSVAVKSAFWRRLAYAGARYGPTPWVRYSPTLFGLGFAAALPELRHRVRANLRATLGERSAWAEGRDVLGTFVQFAHCLAESLACDRPEASDAVRRVDGIDHLRVARAAGKGLIVVTAHAGVWDAAAQLLRGDLDVDVMVAMRAEPDARARGLHDAVRQRRGISIAHVGAHPLDAVPLLRHLRKRGVVAIQIDRPTGNGDDARVELFGRPFDVPRGPFSLASLTGAPVLPIFCSRRGYFDYRVHIAPPLFLPRRASAAIQLDAARRCAAALEVFLRANPTQWFHFDGTAADHRRQPSDRAEIGATKPVAHETAPGELGKTPDPAVRDSL